MAVGMGTSLSTQGPLACGPTDYTRRRQPLTSLTRSPTAPARQAPSGTRNDFDRGALIDDAPEEAEARLQMPQIASLEHSGTRLTTTQFMLSLYGIRTEA